MKRSLAATGALCVSISALTVACGSGDDSSAGATSGRPDSTSAFSAAADSAAANASDSAPAEKQPAGRASRRGTSVKVMDSRYGRMLFDGRGRALYLFTKESTSRSRCYGECARAWPPLLTRGKPRARTGVESSLLGTTRRRDGRRQVTYRGQPLYRYVDDGIGQVLCQDVVEFGGTWLVVAPSGAAIR